MMTNTIDEKLHWTEHFAQQGFAVLQGLVDGDYCERALREVRRLTNNDLPLREWTTENTAILHRPFYEGATPPQPELERVFEQPRLRAAIEELYGGAGHWNEARNFYIFLRPYNPQSAAKLSPQGHIDFTEPPAPPLYRGFTFQVALHDTEPFSGNLTIYPGTHRLVQQKLMQNPQWQCNGKLDDVPMPEPFEFAARAGDVLFMHHLVCHSGNESHAAQRTPRVALHCEAFRDEWLRAVDPAQSDLSAWQRSLALNGAYQEPPEIEAFQTQKRSAYMEKLRSEG